MPFSSPSRSPRPRVSRSPSERRRVRRARRRAAERGARHRRACSAGYRAPRRARPVPRLRRGRAGADLGSERPRDRAHPVVRSRRAGAGLRARRRRRRAPVRYPELVARIRAVLRRGAPSAPEVLEAGELVVDRRTRRVAVRGGGLAVGRASSTPAWLASDPYRVFTKDELLRDVWGYGALGRTRTLDLTPPGCETSSRSRRRRWPTSSTCGASGTGSWSRHSHDPVGQSARRLARYARPTKSATAPTTSISTSVNSDASPRSSPCWSSSRFEKIRLRL